MNDDPKNKYPHVINTMIKEHEIILGFLDQIEKNNLLIQDESVFEDSRQYISEIGKLINLIILDELHHQREEKVLFFSLEKQGITNPTKLFRWEHHESRSLKYDIKKIIENINQNNFPESIKELNKLVLMLSISLKEHISKEENYLYPLSLEVFTNSKIWDEMKKECDKIGYCSFGGTV